MQLTARPPSPISDPALPVTAAPASPAAAAAVVAIATVVELAEEGRGAEAKGEDGAGRPRSPTSESVQRSESTARCEAAVPNAACRCACGLSAELTRNQRKRRQHCIWWAARPSARGRPHLVVHHTCSTPRLLYTTVTLHHAYSTPRMLYTHLLYSTLALHHASLHHTPRPPTWTFVQTFESRRRAVSSHARLVNTLPDAHSPKPSCHNTRLARKALPDSHNPTLL